MSRALRVIVYGRFLKDGGSPFFWLGDADWELFAKLNCAETDEYLQARAGQGFNVIQAIATARLSDGALGNPNRHSPAPTAPLICRWLVICRWLGWNVLSRPLRP